MNEENTWFQKPDYPGYRQFLILLGITCAGLLLMGLISVFVLLAHYGVNFKAADINNMPYGLMIYLTIVQDVCLFALPAITFALIVKRRTDYFNLHTKNNVQLWLVVVLIALACLPVSDLLGQLTEKIPLSKEWYNYFKIKENEYDTAALMLINLTSVKYFIISLIMIALLPAIAEELFFRGALQQVMIKWYGNPIAGIIVSAVIFSAFHMSYFGFLSRTMLGIVLGLVYYYGKNIRLNMLIHFINNASVLIGLYIMYGSKPLTSVMLDNSSASSGWYLQMAALIVLIILMKFFIKKSETDNIVDSK
ncbi:MAG: CPBP family intramembrane metalloprotease [Arachidicoccus sp.]|nr:CPBP family intramembrane metalloprotease [Arachidicoccus sp.]